MLDIGWTEMAVIAFVALVIVTVLKDNFMSRLTLWKTLERRRAS